MGYTTTFKGKLKVSPPLNGEEIRFLTNFSATRRMNRKNGPYYCGLGLCGQAQEPDIIDYNQPPEGQPGLWCQWVPTADGKFIEWNGAEKFYYSVEWMGYIIEHFLKENPKAAESKDGGYFEKRFYKALKDRVEVPVRPPEPHEFQDYMAGAIRGGHVLNGKIRAKGEGRGDRWTLIVKNNKVSRLPKLSHD